jgi:hypothetical protein
MDIAIVIVTSPARSNPSVNIICKVIESLKFLSGLEESLICIVFDGYHISNTIQTKRGRISNEMALNYEEYYKTLTSIYNTSRFSFIKSDIHRGFAHCTKLGLEQCMTTYAIVMQHDRVFIQEINNINSILNCFENNCDIRYIGFPTITSVMHTSVIERRYGLCNLNHNSLYIDVSETMRLMPLIFWYDSNHICHIKRYLQIFTPFKSLPIQLRNSVPIGCIKRMTMRYGDFIEDRFGQAQRDLLVSLKDNFDLQLQFFHWFGSYLILSNIFDWTSCSRDSVKMCVMVGHLRGRTYNPNNDSHSNNDELDIILDEKYPDFGTDDSSVKCEVDETI